MISKVNLGRLLERITINIADYPVEDPEFEEKSNSWLLSFLARYKKKANFEEFYGILWPQLKKILGIIEKEQKLNFEAYIEK